MVPFSPGEKRHSVKRLFFHQGIQQVLKTNMIKKNIVRKCRVFAQKVLVKTLPILFSKVWEIPLPVLKSIIDRVLAILDTLLLTTLTLTTFTSDEICYLNDT